MCSSVYQTTDTAFCIKVCVETYFLFVCLCFKSINSLYQTEDNTSPLSTNLLILQNGWHILQAFITLPKMCSLILVGLSYGFLIQKTRWKHVKDS